MVHPSVGFNPVDSSNRVGGVDRDKPVVAIIVSSAAQNRRMRSCSFISDGTMPWKHPVILRIRLKVSCDALGAINPPVMIFCVLYCV